VILLAKSEIHKIDVRREPEYRVCQRTYSCAIVFASSIIRDGEHKPFAVGIQIETPRRQDDELPSTARERSIECSGECDLDAPGRQLHRHEDVLRHQTVPLTTSTVEKSITASPSQYSLRNCSPVEAGLEASGGWP
jgi:hypothetical protein